MNSKFLETISEYSMFTRGDKVIVGLSGGADSVCLFHLLVTNRDTLGISVEAAHLNHGIRGEEAVRDEEFVRSLCSKYEIRLHCRFEDIPAISSETGESTELCARRKRYEFFESLGDVVIATAHTGSDRIETMLMNLSRGASLKGLCSIPPVRGNIVRPLIRFTRAEIEEYCQLNGLEFVTDSSNLTDDYTRNNFRHNVIPALVQINPSFEKNALRCIESLNCDREYLEGAATAIFNECYCNDKALDITSLREKGGQLLSRVIIRFIETVCDADYEMRHIAYISENLENKFSIMLPSGVRISGNGKKLFVDNSVKVAEKNNEIVYLDKNSLKDALYNKKTVRIYLTDTLPSEVDEFFAVDADKISDKICIRTRCSGDGIYLKKRRCTKTLRKLFNELSIPVEIRDSLIVIADENGVICVENIGIDSTRGIDSETKEYMIIKFEVDKNE